MYVLHSAFLNTVCVNIYTYNSVHLDSPYNSGYIYIYNKTVANIINELTRESQSGLRQKLILQVSSDAIKCVFYWVNLTIKGVLKLEYF